jgi:hypothetical protein
MEAFGLNNIVRRVMLENAREYHTVIATCPTLTVNDLIEAMQSQTISEEVLIRLLKWWPKICKIDQRVGRYGLSLKEAICFESNSTVQQNASAQTDAKSTVRSLDSILYYTSNKLIKDLPLPETAIETQLQKAVGLRNLEDRSFSQWFSPLPFDIWASFMSTHHALTQASFDDHKLRIQVLAALSKHYDSLASMPAKSHFINLLSTKTMYLPVDTHGKKGTGINQYLHPSEMYLSSSDLSAFEGLGKFEKGTLLVL